MVEDVINQGAAEYSKLIIINSRDWNKSRGWHSWIKIHIPYFFASNMMLSV